MTTGQTKNPNVFVCEIWIRNGETFFTVFADDRYWRATEIELSCLIAGDEPSADWLVELIDA